MSPVIIGIILARIDSSRLPGKVMHSVQDTPLIGYVIERAKAIPGLSNIVLATTNRSIDDPLATYAQAQNIAVYRGSTQNVAFRVLQCAKIHQCDYFVRLNGDSPFLDPELIGEGITYCFQKRVDMITNLVGRTYPYGVSVEIIRTATFEQTYYQLENQEEREHVTPYFYRNLEQFAVHTLTLSPPYKGKERLVVDTFDDMKKFEQVVQHLGKKVFNIKFQEAVKLYQTLSGEMP
jgi:spore coat polysaccharide biosynthesis protein SpsF